MEEKKEIRFYKDTDEYYEFSNYYKSSFSVNNHTYFCNEQFYQCMKFYEPNNERMMYYSWLISETDSPQKTKDLGQQKKSRYSSKWFVNKNKPALGMINDRIDEFKDLRVVSNWEDIKEDVMWTGLYAKFTQNKKLFDLLIGTGDKIIIENSAIDFYWGCGSDNTGKNILGIQLMTLRNLLRS